MVSKKYSKTKTKSKIPIKSRKRKHSRLRKKINKPKSLKGFFSKETNVINMTSLMNYMPRYYKETVCYFEEYPTHEDYSQCSDSPKNQGYTPYTKYFIFRLRKGQDILIYDIDQQFLIHLKNKYKRSFYTKSIKKDYFKRLLNSILKKHRVDTPIRYNDNSFIGKTS